MNMPTPPPQRSLIPEVDIESDYDYNECYWPT